MSFNKGKDYYKLLGVGKRHQQKRLRRPIKFSSTNSIKTQSRQTNIRKVSISLRMYVKRITTKGDRTMTTNSIIETETII